MVLVSQQGIPKKYLFQIYLNADQIDKRLKITKQYSQTQISGVLLNCANLSLVVLGLVKAEYYLEACTIRKKTTEDQELLDYITDALRQCGNNAKLYGTELINYSKNTLEDLIDSLSNEYATGLVIQWTNNTGHMLIIGKNEDGDPYILDPQIPNQDGSYPLKIEGVDNIHNYFKGNVKGYHAIYSPTHITIGKTKSLAESCVTHSSPMIINEPKITVRNIKIKQKIKQLLAKSEKIKKKKSVKKNKEEPAIKELSNSNIFNMWMGLKKSRRKGNASRRKLLASVSRKAKKLVAAHESRFGLTRKYSGKKTFAKRPLQSRESQKK